MVGCQTGTGWMAGRRKGVGWMTRGGSSVAGDKGKGQMTDGGGKCGLVIRAVTKSSCSLSFLGPQ